ncbi:MAG: hypothetical protein H3C30_16050 [Candidatus Hydrogenedentes bacterium]|nr:hypothetical protein [Candidatus Hydrogenedentota bacterium]
MLEAQAKERMSQGAANMQAQKHGGKGGMNSPHLELRGKSTTQAGELLGVSGDTVKKAKRIAQADPELAAKVRDGEGQKCTVRKKVHFSLQCGATCDMLCPVVTQQYQGFTLYAFNSLYS